jgi:hypothetical protein
VRPRWELGLILILAVAAALVLVLGGGGGRPLRRSSLFGADFGVLFQSRYPSAVVSRALTGAADSGLGLARVAPLWELTQPQPPRAGRQRYDWRYDDNIAKQLAGHGFRWVAVLAFAPPWASLAPVLHSAPRGTERYAAYAVAVARRYRGLISAFEVWNEEDTRAFWRPRPDPVAYARLYAAARRAIHQADPGVPVLIGGLAGGHPAFLRTLLVQPELRAAVDGLAIHAYAATPARVLAQVEAYRALLDRRGFGTVPLYVTEYGWSSRRVPSTPFEPVVPPGSYAPPAIRPRFIVQAARETLSSGCNVRMAIFYAWLTQEQNPHALYDWYGVAGRRGGPTPATQAIGRAVVALHRPRAITAAACPAPG